MYDNQILKNYMRDKKYSECVAFLKKKIVSFVINQIKLKDETVGYTTVSDLISLSDYYLKNSTIARNLQYALLQENQLVQIENLVLICEENNIK